MRAVLAACVESAGGGTTLIGVLPTYAGVGEWGSILLVGLRKLQGLSAGAEYGAVILLVE